MIRETNISRKLEIKLMKSNTKDNVLKYREKRKITDHTTVEA